MSLHFTFESRKRLPFPKTPRQAVGDGRTDQSFCPDAHSQKEKDTPTNTCLSTTKAKYGSRMQYKVLAHIACRDRWLSLGDSHAYSRAIAPILESGRRLFKNSFSD